MTSSIESSSVSPKDSSLLQSPSPVRIQSISVHSRSHSHAHPLSDDGVESSPSPSSSSHDVPSPSPFSLTFPDALLEQKFRYYFFHKRHAQTKVIGLLLLIVLSLLAVYEQFALTNDYRIPVTAVRFGVQIPLAIVWYWTIFTRTYFNHHQWINLTCALLIGSMNVIFSILGGDPSHGPQMLFYFLVYFFLQLRVVNSAFVCSTLFVGWVVGVKYSVPSYHRLLISSAYMIVANFSLMIATYLTEYWLRIDFVRHHLLILEERKTSDLLSTLLPDRITEQLRDLLASDGLDENLIAEDHPNVSILFSDIVGFTAYSSTLTAREVVNFLSNLYTVLDYLTVDHEVLKVETIGDAYFVASGVITPRTDHALLLANFSFDMLDTIKQFKLKGGKSLHMRIGMHSGRVIAGVVGLKVPRFHLFGQNCMIASLMEQTGEPDRIHISSSIADDLIRWTDEDGVELFHIEPRIDPIDEADQLSAKRLHMETFWLTDGRQRAETIPRTRNTSHNHHHGAIQTDRKLSADPQCLSFNEARMINNSIKDERNSDPTKPTPLLRLSSIPSDGVPPDSPPPPPPPPPLHLPSSPNRVESVSLSPLSADPPISPRPPSLLPSNTTRSDDTQDYDGEEFTDDAALSDRET